MALIGSHAIVVAVVLLISASGSQATTVDLHDIAQQVARLACPFAMMQSYGCPINITSTSPPTTTVRSAVGVDGSGGTTFVSTTDSQSSSGATSSNGRANTTSSSSSILGDQGQQLKEKHWNVGDVPIGVGFDTTKMKVTLPMFYPVGTKEYVFDITSQNQTYTTIEDYAGSISPTAMKALMTGALNTDTSHVFKTFFGSYDFLHRTTIVDVISKATMNTTHPQPLPMVQEGLNNLPDPYTAAAATEYAEFFKYFGTHVVTEAAIGGALESLVSIKSCYAGGRSTMIANDAQIEMATKTLLDPTSTKLNQAYIEHRSDFTVSMYGGDPTIFKESEWTKRERTIAEQPVLIKVDDMVPLSYFLTGSKKTAMDAAITAYQNAEIADREAKLAAAKAAQTFEVTAVTTVDFDNFHGSFGYREHQCHRCWGFFHCCNCNGETACFNPGSCSTGCGGTSTGTIIVPDQPKEKIHRMGQAAMSPKGSTACTCSSGYGGFESPSFPFNKLDQTVTCSIDAHGHVQATNVINPDWDQYKTGGTKTQTDGDLVETGCSVATATYTGMEYTVTGGNQGCGASTGTLSTTGTITAKGYCCVSTTAVPTWNEGSTNCYGSLTTGSCPGFN